MWYDEFVEFSSLRIEMETPGNILESPCVQTP